MDTRWMLLLVIGFYTITAQAPAEERFSEDSASDYWQNEDESLLDETQSEESKIDEQINNDKVLNDDEFVDEKGEKYSINEVINSALAEGLNGGEDDLKSNIDAINDDGNKDENYQIEKVPDNNVEYEEQEIVENSDETRVRDEMESFRKELAGEGDAEEVDNEEDVDGNLDDYQFEDNRSEVKEDVRNDVQADNDGSIENQDFKESVDFKKLIINDPVQNSNNNDESIDSVGNEDVIKYLMPVNLDINDNANSNVAVNEETDAVNVNNEASDDIQQLIDETNQLLQEDSSNMDEDQDAVNEVEDIAIQQQVPQNDYDQLDYEDIPDKEQTFVDYIDGIQEDEIQKFLVEKDNQNEQDTLDEQNIREINDEQEQELEPESDEDQDADTVEKVKADLNEDLERLYDTWNKLSHDSEEQPENMELSVEQVLGEYVEQPEDEGQDLEQGVEQPLYKDQSVEQVLGEGVEQPEDEGQDLKQGVEQPLYVDQSVEQVLEEGVEQSENEGQDLEQGVEQPVYVEQSVEPVQGKGVELLVNEGQDLEQGVEKPENVEKPAGNVEEYESKYGKPYGEDIVLAQREETDGDDGELAEEDNMAIESNLGDILMLHNIAQIEIEEQEVVNIADIDSEEEDANVEELNVKSEPADESINDESINDESRNIVAGASIIVEDKEEDEVLNNENIGLNVEIAPEIKIEDVEKLIKAGDHDTKFDDLSNETDENDRTVDEKNEKAENDLGENKSEQIKNKSEDVAHLTSTQYDDLMRQFAMVYSDDIEVTDKTEVSKFEIDESTSVTVTSPNYPEPYPTDSTVDYYFHGEGIGIEFNITDLDLNGAIGDYLLIKPGSSDETGSEGLIFSYHLTEPRSYRFLDVNQLFVRFRSNPGLGGKKGFSYSVKMVAPLPNDNIPGPSPAPLLPPPATTTVYLGGIPVNQFMSIMEYFRMIVADMATAYINTKGIDAGKNTTAEVTQITSVGYCNIEWPSFDVCVEVKFGVPLVYEDSDDNKLTEQELYEMWSTLFYTDPFAYRLRQLNILEFSTPNDHMILRSWLVVGSGVMLAAALLIFVMWRFSCFQGYTRMSPYSDTDSIRDEKRNLDLYPTPHQTLPPLYSYGYQWVHDDAARVDMGGFTNRNYTRDDLFDIDSDEDIPTPSPAAPRDRYTSDV